MFSNVLHVAFGLLIAPEESSPEQLSLAESESSHSNSECEHSDSDFWGDSPEEFDTEDFEIDAIAMLKENNIDFDLVEDIPMRLLTTHFSGRENELQRIGKVFEVDSDDS